MATKIETDLSPEQLLACLQRIAQTKGGMTGPAIKAVCAEFGVVISHETANQYRKGVVADYLKQLEANTQRAKDIVAIATNGVGLADAAAVKLMVKINDDLDTAGELTVDEKSAYSLAIARMRAGDVRARDLERKLADSEAARENAAQRLQLQQFDAVQAAITHAKEIRSVLGNKKLDDGQKTERVRQILFGAQPADFRPVQTRGTGDSEQETGEGQA